MRPLLNILKWIPIILFFPVSSIFVAYFRQRRMRRHWHAEKKVAARSSR